MTSLRRFIRGFTLVEVLIAMLIFAVLSTMTFRALEGSLRVQERVEQRAGSLNAFQVAWTVMLHDFVNLARRPVRGVFGDLQRAFVQQDGDCVISFTRTSGEGSIAFARAGLQRISYCLQDGNLYRLVWPVLDRVQGTEAQRGLLMENVDTFTVAVEPPLNAVNSEDPIDPREYEFLPQGKIVIEIATEEGVFTRWFPGVDVR